MIPATATPKHRVIVTLRKKSKCHLVLIMTFFVPRALRMLRIPVMSALSVKFTAHTKDRYERNKKTMEFRGMLRFTSMLLTDAQAKQKCSPRCLLLPPFLHLLFLPLSGLLFMPCTFKKIIRLMQLM